jgi:ABC-type Fe3+/spermidine/putrescine transport system ATPase subunit
MSAGKIEQNGRPKDLYETPGSAMVRDFLGRTLMLEGEVIERQGDLVVVKLERGDTVSCSQAGSELSVGTRCQVAIRPEKATVRPAGGDGGANRLRGQLEALLFVGDRYEARIDLGGVESVTVYLPPVSGWEDGQEVSIELPTEELRVWPV